MPAAGIQNSLKERGVRLTRQRLILLELIDRSGRHLDAETLYQMAHEKDPKLNRVTVYRTLQTFVEKGIIHIIPTTDNSVRYALCKNNCTEGHHHDDHIHFICLQCGKILCLQEAEVPKIALPKGFTISEIEVVVKGVCVDCNQ